ncbi:hypothetical protein ACLK1S_17325 [Escherichia coli]
MKPHSEIFGKRLTLASPLPDGPGNPRYFRGGGFSPLPSRRRRPVHHDRQHHRRPGPVLQIAEGWSRGIAEGCA